MRKTMTRNDSASPIDLGQELDKLFKEFGIIRVLYALTKRALKPRVPTVAASELSSHLRRDMGLPPSTGSPDYHKYLR